MPNDDPRLRPPPPAKVGLMRSLGRFVGHLGSAARARPAKTQEVSRSVEQRAGTTPDGRSVILRRTTIEEVEVREDDR